MLPNERKFWFPFGLVRSGHFPQNCSFPFRKEVDYQAERFKLLAIRSVPPKRASINDPLQIHRTIDVENFSLLTHLVFKSNEVIEPLESNEDLLAFWSQLEYAESCDDALGDNCLYLATVLLQESRLLRIADDFLLLSFLTLFNSSSLVLVEFSSRFLNRLGSCTALKMAYL
uniref:Uncharacterized protein n=1 Tax=Romanomermis culicivorax TaxID=13658 RepID=A0A915HQF0_ROMCU